MLIRLRNLVWYFLSFCGIVATLWVWIVSNGVFAFWTGVLSCLVLFGWGTLSSWIWGITRQIRKHMKQPIEQLTFVTKQIGISREADYIRVFEDIVEKQKGSLRFGTEDFVKLSALKNQNFGITKINWESVEAEDDSLINVPSNAVYLLNHFGRPFVVRLGGEQNKYDYENEAVVSTGKGQQFQLCARSLDEANEITAWLRKQTGLNSIYRGQMLLVASPQDGSLGQTIRITKRPSQPKDRIVLPENIIQTALRLIDSRLKHRDRLVQLGHSANLGLLFHGVPGTGKTLMIRYLVSHCTDHTVIVPSDMAVETLRESFRLAQYLQPAIVILEDVDLLAPQRQTSRSVDGLQELMNQLDGLPSSSDTIVLMSTNQPDVLEPALASRPGRVSQAIEFHVPEAADREKLLNLFLSELKISFDMSQWSQRTAGASPAFIEELCKRAILFSMERSGADTSGENQLEIVDQDLDSAIHELVIVGGELTSKSLGFPAAK